MDPDRYITTFEGYGVHYELHLGYGVARAVGSTMGANHQPAVSVSSASIGPYGLDRDVALAAVVQGF